MYIVLVGPGIYYMHDKGHKGKFRDVLCICRTGWRKDIKGNTQKSYICMVGPGDRAWNSKDRLKTKGFYGH